MTRATFAVLCGAAALSGTASAADNPRPTLSGDELRFYLMGFVDGATPTEWGAVASRCAVRSGAYRCTVVARTRDGRARCWRARISRRGLFLTPLARTACRENRALLVLHE